MSEPAVVVRGLCKSFGAKEAVAGIDLERHGAGRWPGRLAVRRCRSGKPFVST